MRLYRREFIFAAMPPSITTWGRQSSLYRLRNIDLLSILRPVWICLDDSRRFRSFLLDFLPSQERVGFGRELQGVG